MIGARIRRARLAKGMSLERLATQVGVSKQAIHKYEQGKAMPGSDVLLRLSKSLNVKTEYFFRPVEAKLQEVNFRRQSGLSAKEQKAISETTKDAMERYLILEDVFPPNELSTPSYRKLPIEINKPADVEIAANEVRKKWKLGVDPIENMTELLENHGIKVIEVEAGEKFDGLSGVVDGKHAVIVIQADWPGERQRFTLAHELGHLVLNIAPDCSSKISERCCHRFAAAFLVPESTVFFELGQKRRHLDYGELFLLKQKYGLSMQAWIVRARDLDIITESLCTEMFKDINRRGWRKKEPEGLLPEKPSRFKRMLLHALAENLITETKASDILGVRVGQLRQTIEEWTPCLKNA